MNEKPQSGPPMFYYGCHRDLGHYMWHENGEEVPWRRATLLQPWAERIDGGLCPGSVVNGVARFTQEHGWSALSWWDNSIDSRPGSHSTFIVQGVHTAAVILRMARERFPWVFSRFSYAVVLPTAEVA